MPTALQRYLELLKKKIDRKSLIAIATKLKIAGHTNRYSRPYIKKNDLKTLIFQELKKRSNHRGRIKSASQQRGGQSPQRRRIRSIGSIRERKASLSPRNYNVSKLNTIRLPKVRRLIAIGDIHGDVRGIVRALKVAGVIPLDIPENNSIHESIVPWIGGSTVVVQLGDQIDRVRPTSWQNDCTTEDIPCDEGSDLKIMNLLDNLHKKAKKEGGAVISILGNHELMNVDGDFRYVSLNEFSEFGLALSGKKINNNYPFGYKERKTAFAPGGIIAKRMADTRYGVVQVGSWIFVHGGITSKLALRYSIDHINYYTKEWLRGNQDPAIINAIDNLFHNDDSDYSPYWSRLFSDHDDWDEEQIRYEFDNVIKILNSQTNGIPIIGMIVGHSPQYMWDKGINSSFGNRLWRVDIGMSRAFGPLHMKQHYRKIQVLEIRNDTQISVLMEK